MANVTHSVMDLERAEEGGGGAYSGALASPFLAKI